MRQKENVTAKCKRNVIKCNKENKVASLSVPLYLNNKFQLLIKINKF